MKRSSLHTVSLWLCITMSLAVAAGCAAPGISSQQQTPSEAVSIENSVSTAVSFEKTWDQFVAQLSQSFFVINNIEKDSRIINVSFTSDSPELYVDCGTSRRDFEFREEKRTYTYPTAASASFKTAGTWGPYNNLPSVYDFHRKAVVEGRANIYVAPTDDGAVVSVNAVYVWTVDVTGVATVYNAYGTLVTRNTIDKTTYTVRLTTQEGADVNWGGGDTGRCHATGKFERDVLGLVPL